MRNARHAEVHADFAALAVEVGHQLLEDILLVLFGDVGVVLHGLAVNAELVLGSELELTLDLFEHVALGMTDGAFRRGSFAFVDVTADLANKFLHDKFLHFIIFYNFPKSLPGHSRTAAIYKHCRFGRIGQHTVAAKRYVFFERPYGCFAERYDTDVVVVYAFQITEINVGICYVKSYKLRNL